MPTYEYQCRACGAVIEVVHAMREAGPATCEACGGVLRRVLFPTGIIFKGSGFYRTDSRAGGDAPSTSETKRADTPTPGPGGSSTTTGAATDASPSAPAASPGPPSTDGGA